MGEWSYKVAWVVVTAGIAVSQGCGSTGGAAGPDANGSGNANSSGATSGGVGTENQGGVSGSGYGGVTHSGYGGVTHSGGAASSTQGGRDVPDSSGEGGVGGGMAAGTAGVSGEAPVAGGRSPATGGQRGDAGEAGAPNPEGSGGAPDCPSESQPLEGDVVEGDQVIATAEQANALRTVTQITGDLQVASSYSGVLELPNLRVLGGSLVVESPLIENHTAIDWGRMTELRLPNLQSIGGRLYLYLTNALVETDFHRLESVGAEVYIYRNVALRRIGLDSLSQAPSVYFADDLAAAQCEVDAICSRVGKICGPAGGSKCSCELLCGRIVPHC